MAEKTMKNTKTCKDPNATTPAPHIPAPAKTCQPLAFYLHRRLIAKTPYLRQVESCIDPAPP